MKSILIPLLIVGFLKALTCNNGYKNFVEPYTSNSKSIKIDSLTKYSLINSVWRNHFPENKCVDVLVLKPNGNFILDNNCEVMDSIYGVWKIYNDTLILESIGSFYDSAISETHADFDRMKWKIIISNDTMKWLFAYTWDYNTNCFDAGKKLEITENNFVRNQ